MKIVIATSRPFHLVHLSRELAQLGHEVTTFGYMPKAFIQNYNPGKANYKSLFLRYLPYTALALQKRWPQYQHLATEHLFENLDTYLYNHLPECDVFIGLSGVICNAFKVAKDKYGAVTICDRGSSHVKSQMTILKDVETSRLTENYIQRELAGYINADYVAVPSMYSERTFREQNFDMNRVFVNNYGVDLTRFKTPISPKTARGKRLLFVGNWSFRKGADILSSALEEDSSLELTHIGTPGDIPFPTSSRFKSLGSIPNDQLHEHYQSHDIFVLPSREDGFGMVLLEALACGTPVVASTNTGAPDIKKIISNDSSIELMTNVTSKSLLEAVKKINASPFTPEHHLLSVSDQRFFSWEEYGKRYSDFLKHLRPN